MAAVALFKSGRRRPPDGAGAPRDEISVVDLERFGWYCYHLEDNPWPSAWQDFVSPMLHRCMADQDAFLNSLADIATQYGGLVSYGAEQLMIEVAYGRPDHPACRQIMDASIAFLRTSGIPPMKVTGHEWRHWTDSGGTVQTWVRWRPAPSESRARISPLVVGESRRVAQLRAAEDSNVFLVERAEDGRYRWIVDARRGDDDPTRTRWVHVTAGSLHELYVRVGLALQSPPYWCHAELEPYIPLPRPAI